MPKPLHTRTHAPTEIDPVSLARQTKVPVSDRLLTKEPLRTWVVGLLELKAERGRKYSWQMMVAQLMDASKAALENPKARVLAEGTLRQITAPERETLREFVRREYLANTLSWLAQESFPELWARVQGKRSA